MHRLQIKKLHNFFTAHKLHTYKKGEVIERPGNDQRYLYYIHEGFVKQYSISNNGKEFTLDIFTPGSYFYAIFPCCNNIYSYYFAAQTPLKCCRVVRSEVAAYVKNDKDCLNELVEKMQMYGLTYQLSRVESLVFGNTQTKVANAFVLAAEQFGEPVKNSETVKIRVPLTHKDIASLAGVTRETASIEILKFRKQGILSVQKPYFHINSLRGMREASVVN